MIEIRHEKMNDAKATQEAYNEIYKNKGILHLDSVYLWLIQLMRPRPNASLLDIACGEGRLVVLAQQQHLRAVGVDFAIEGVCIGNKISPESGWSVGDGERLPFADQSFDYVTHIGSLEHFINPQLGAQEIYRVLKPHGKACVLVPNTFGLFGNIQYVIKTGDVFDDGQPLQRYGTRGEWEKMLTATGLIVERVCGYAGSGIVVPRTWGDFFWLARRPQKLVRFFLNFIFSVNLTNHLVYICSRG